MPQSAYLTGTDTTAYNVTGSTAQIAQASAMVDSYLKRTQGLVFGIDSAGLPAYMVAAQPVASGTLATSISPGSNVVVTLSGIMVTNDLVGEVAILDRAISNQTEACTVIAVNGQQVTFGIVGNNHSGAATADFGLVIAEERQLPERRALTRASQLPVVRMVAASGRYSYGRRSDQLLGFDEEFNLLADLSVLGGPPLWVPIDVTQCSINTIGDVWVPPGIYMANYTEVRLRYVAGWLYGNLPWQIKQATANITNALAKGVIPTQLRNYTIGPLTGERFSQSQIDQDTMRLLEPFKSRTAF